MSFFSVKLRYVILFLLLGAAIIYLAVGENVKETFMSGNRNLPVYSVDRSDTRLALTFNCAWNDSDIDDILKLLEKYNVKSTFFVVGDWAEKYPDALKKISAAGHEIGEHSYSHSDYTTLSDSQIADDIEKTAAVISGITGSRPTLVRVPSGAYNSRVITAVEKCGYIAVQWSVDSIDYAAQNCEEIFSRASVAAPGDIVLMHNGTRFTASALPRLLDSLCSKYTLVPASQLIYNENFYVDATGKMKLK